MHRTTGMSPEPSVSTLYFFIVVGKLCLILLGPRGLQPARLPCPWDFPSKNTGVGSYFLLRRIFQTQRSNPSLLHGRQILYHRATREALPFHTRCQFPERQFQLCHICYYLSFVRKSIPEELRLHLCLLLYP